MWNRLLLRIGHRGAFLSFLSLLDILYGYSILSETNTLAHYHVILLPQTWGVIWLVAGIFIATGIPVRHDRAHFGVAAAVKAAWATALVNVWFTQDYPLMWVNVVIFAAFAALVVVVSSWPELRRYRPQNENGPPR